ncbi:MAG: AtpZ/AtpI family protein [Candidatus Acidulodesulfobacterium acidiphilum]|uniref:AtpZ/AtpI family protein n=1 Tax=Candidatus Acidulodesulfobacterium acidiphilum TaxID=2597224 RepID=A0A520XEM7_9DELT|nr:MAG: AtpZ/AtpI family protein [Candidatus Acidulodesulfobacterium acidiphilum]
MDKEFIKQIARMSSLGLNIIISVLIGVFIGIEIDKYLNFKYLFLIIFSALGFIAGIYEIYKAVKRELNEKP